MTKASIGRGRAALFAGCLLATSGASAQQNENTILALPTLSLTFSAAYIASDLVLWEKNGLNMRIVDIAGIGAINSVIAGSSDFAQTTAGAFTRAAAKGQRMLAIANLIDRPMLEVVLRTDLAKAGNFDPSLPIEKRAGILKGKTIAVDAINSIVHGYLRLTAIGAGLDPDQDLRIAPMQPTSMIAAFKNRSIDGMTMSQPWTLMPVHDGSGTIIASSPNGDYPEMVPFGYNLLVTRPEVCEKRRSVCEKIGRAFSQAVDYLHEKPAESFAILQKRFPQMDVDLLRKSVDLIRVATPRPPAVTEKGLENAEFYNVNSRLLKPEEKVTSFKGLYTGEFVR